MRPRNLPFAPTASVAILLAGCATDAPEAPPEPLTVEQRVDVLDGKALREPMIVVHPQGPLFAAGYSRAPEEFTDPPNLYRSDDGGASWEPVDVGGVEEGALGNSDVDLAVAPDGTLFFLTMGFDRSVGEGTHVAVGVSRDVGRTWRWHELSRTRFDDRPWIAVAPGAVHVIWNDGEGVSHAVSRDGGATWQEGPRIHPRGGSSHLAIGPAGEIAVRITPASASGSRFDEGVDHVAVSSDDGLSWAIHDVPGRRSWARDLATTNDIPRWVEPLAWGSDGTLYSLWSEGSTLWLGRSDDLGETWTSSRLIEDSVPLYYPLLAAGPDGALAATWFSGLREALRAHVGIIRDDPAGAPAIRRAAPLPVDAWAGEDGARLRDPAGEYFPAVFLPDGDVGAVLPIQGSSRGDGFSWVRIAR